MAATGFEAVLSLSKKAFELFHKTHYERSLEKWRAALAAAEALGAEDCVIVAASRNMVARALFVIEMQRDVVLSRAFVDGVLAMYSESAATLRRRRDAGTLLQGGCRPNELQWTTQLSLVDASFLHGGARAQAVECMAFVPPLHGYITFIETCIGYTGAVGTAIHMHLFEPGEEAERACLSFACDLCDDAVALMIARHVPLFAVAAEAAFSSLMPRMIENLVAQAPVCDTWRKRLSQALTRLNQSGVMKERGLNAKSIAEHQANMLKTRGPFEQECARAAAAGELRICALASCAAREAHVSHFSKCGACKTVAYCCKEHQVADWSDHKAACKAARKGAAANAAA